MVAFVLKISKKKYFVVKMDEKLNKVIDDVFLVQDSSYKLIDLIDSYLNQLDDNAIIPYRIIRLQKFLIMVNDFDLSTIAIIFATKFTTNYLEHLFETKLNYKSLKNYMLTKKEQILSYRIAIEMVEILTVLATYCNAILTNNRALRNYCIDIKVAHGKIIDNLQTLKIISQPSSFD
jgi:hypothetical protein